MFKIGICLVVGIVVLLFTLGSFVAVSTQQHQREPPGIDFQEAVQESPENLEGERRRNKKNRRNETRCSSPKPCTICLEDLIDSDKYILSCKHSFHKECLKRWFDEKVPRKTCPCCRAVVHQ